MDRNPKPDFTRISISAILAGLHVEIAILIFCAIILMGTGNTKGPVFDAVGPDFLPTAVAVIVGLMVLVQIVRQVVGNVRQARSPLVVNFAAWRKAVIFSLVMMLVVAVLAYHILPLYLASSAFVACTTVLISDRPSWRDVLYGLVSGLVLGAVLQYVFTEILFIDLSG